MYLGIIDFNYNKFYLLGLLGYLVLGTYLLFIITSIKNGCHSFAFSIFVLIIYFLFIFYISFGFGTSITCANLLWYIPFLLCTIVEGTIYLIKKYKNSRK